MTLRRRGAALAAVLLGLLLQACGSAPQQAKYGLVPGRGSYRVGQPYEVNGVWYYPRVDYHYDKTGIASWYGPGFDGRPTANGETYDMNAVSAAHKTLPLPSVVEVTNLQNGRSLQLRVNDRGPFVGDRILDVSRRAAQLLGFAEQGTAPVRVKILKRQSIEVAEAAMHGGSGPLLAEAAAPAAVVAAAPAAVVAAAPPPAAKPPPAEPPPQLAAAPPAEPPAQQEVAASPLDVLAPPANAAPLVLAAYRPAGGHYFIQVGAYAVEDNAQRAHARIASLGSVEVTPASVNGAELYRVRLGPFASREAANEMLARVIGSGYPGARIVSD
ncbi:MAG TPA: septal ring lytic transglycosylase RlpA family protein [Stellaceae bacterium]|nr:septal ring lytic transglycosylase RlpA family protein [Stellaceae bacterium]